MSPPPNSPPDSLSDIEFRTIDYDNETELRSYLRLLWEIPLAQNEYFTNFSEAFLEDWLKQTKANETESNTFSGVAFHRGQIVGLHVVRRYEEYQQIGAHIAGLWVRPGYERRGIARTLKTRGEAWARSIGAVFMNTNVHAGNARMMELNQAAGFDLFRYNLRKRL